MSLTESKYVLSKNEIDLCKMEGLINPKIYEIPSRTAYGNMSEEFLQSAGVKVAFVSGGSKETYYGMGGYYLTDQFMIICGRAEHGWQGKNYVVTKLPELSFISLENIEICELVFYRNDHGYISPTFSTQKKGVVKGAVIGGVIAGPAGAVVGAIAGNEEKSVMKTPGRYYDDNTYSLLIRTRDGIEIREKRYVKYEKKDSTSINSISTKNSISKKLISSAKPFRNLINDYEYKINNIQTLLKEVAIKEEEEREKARGEAQKKKKLFIRCMLGAIAVIIVLIVISKITQLNNTRAASEEYLEYLNIQAESMLEDEESIKYGIKNVSYEVSQIRSLGFGTSYWAAITISCQKQSNEDGYSSEYGVCSLVKKYFKSKAELPSGKTISLKDADWNWSHGYHYGTEMITILINGRVVDKPEKR